MDASYDDRIESIVSEAAAWPAEVQGRLERKLAARRPGRTLPPKKRGSLIALLGVANPTGRQFTDEEVDQLRYEALAEKYLK